MPNRLPKGVKQLIRKVLNNLHLDLTRNLKYDRLTQAIMQLHLKPDSNCIDIGCHEGEMLEMMLRYAPNGQHYAFEPIPEMFQILKQKYGNLVRVYPYALSSESGMTTFHHVKNAPAYSGIIQRDYKTNSPDIDVIQVKMEKLDNILPLNHRIDFIKLDMEGAELHVLKGAIDAIIRNKPLILFEFGLGASNHYGTQPEDIWDILSNQCAMRIFTLEGYLNNQLPLTLEKLKECYLNNTEYYFVSSK